MTRDEQLALWRRLETMPYLAGKAPLRDQLDHASLMRCLDMLAETLVDVAERNRETERNLANLREDVRGFGRVMRLAADLAGQEM